MWPLIACWFTVRGEVARHGQRIEVLSRGRGAPVPFGIEGGQHIPTRDDVEVIWGVDGPDGAVVPPTLVRPTRRPDGGLEIRSERQVVVQEGRYEFWAQVNGQPQSIAVLVVQPEETA